MRCHTIKKSISRHARKRFLQRVGKRVAITDEEMLWYASIPNKKYKFIWKFRRSRFGKGHVMERRLVTVIPKGGTIED